MLTHASLSIVQRRSSFRGNLPSSLLVVAMIGKLQAAGKKLQPEPHGYKDTLHSKKDTVSIQEGWTLFQSRLQEGQCSSPRLQADSFSVQAGTVQSTYYHYYYSRTIFQSRRTVFQSRGGQYLSPGVQCVSMERISIQADNVSVQEGQCSSPGGAIFQPEAMFQPIGK